MTTMFNPEMLENTIKHIETKEIPLVEQQYAEMESNYHRIAKNLLSTRDEEGNTTLDAQQTEELLDLLSQFNHISHELVLERKSRLRLCKEFLADSRKHITVKIPKFLKK